MVERACPSRHDQLEDRRCKIARRVRRDLDRRRGALEEPKSTLGVRLVLGPAAGCAHAVRLTECLVHILSVVGRTIVEQQGQRLLAGGVDAIRERLDHGGRVFLITN